MFYLRVALKIIRVNKDFLDKALILLIMFPWLPGLSFQTKTPAVPTQGNKVSFAFLSKRLKCYLSSVLSG